MSFKTFESLCTPAKIYFAIALISCIIALFGGIPILAVFFKLLFAFIWTYILAWLCKHGYKTISWFLVLLPYIVIVFGLFGVFILSKQHKTILNTVKLQGPFGGENFTNKHR